MRAGMMVLVALLVGLGVGWYVADTSTEAPDAIGASHAGIDDADGGFGVADDDDDIDVRERLVPVDGEVRIRLTPAEIELGGIRTTVPDATESTSTVRYAGRVLAAGPLLTRQAQLRAMTSEVNAQRSVIATLDKRLAELTAGSRLGAQRDISALQLERARTRAHAEVLKAKRDAARTALEAQWGTTLVANTTAADGTARLLLNGNALLIGFNLPTAAAAPVATFSVTLAGQTLTAKNMGPSPVALPGMPGRGWYGLVDDLQSDAGDEARFAAGMPVAVWSSGATAISGVLLPRSAIVWDGDGRWVFLMPAPNEYVRRAVGEVVEQPHGLLVTGIPSTLPVVIAGVQNLQGERFHGAIPDEDED